MRLLLAGGENSQASRVLRAIKAPNVLLSYYYLRNKPSADIIRLLQDYRKQGAEFLFLDSGAHTFFTEGGIGDLSKTHKKETKTNESPEAYFRKYLGWLKIFGNRFNAYAELDIDRVEGVGIEKVLDWRKQMKEAGLDKLLPVYHESMPMEMFEQMCKEYKYVGVEGQKSDGRYSTYFRIAREHKTKIHGFAMTKIDKIKRFPFYSGDSTTWKTGSQYGLTFFFRGDKVEQYGKDDKAVRRRYKVQLESFGLNWNKIQKDDMDEIDKMNALAWIQCGKKVDELQEQKGKYWETNKQAKKTNNGDQLGIHKGSIQEKLKDPKVAEKRLINQKKWAKTGLAHLKHGRYARFPLMFPDKDYAISVAGKELDVQEVYRNVLSTIEGFNLSDDNQVLKMLNDLIRADLIRATKGMVYEAADGGVQDRALSTLINNISNRLLAVIQAKRQSTEDNVTVVQQNAVNVINKMDEKRFKQFDTKLEELGKLMGTRKAGKTHTS